MHSQNATEQSDLYSIGAVIYYLFTGEQPPVVTCFHSAIDKASGFDVSLKPIIKKLVAEAPEERYKDISELKSDLSGLLDRFLDLNFTAVLTVDHEKFSKLKNMNLIPRNSTISDLRTILPTNFVELHINQDGEIYQFLGTNYFLECIYNAATNIFQVADVKKVVPLNREIMKKKFCELSARLDFQNPRFIHRLSKNDNLEIKNIVDGYCLASSDELKFEFFLDDSDKYKNEFYTQMKEHCRPCQEYFFEKSRDFVNRIAGQPIKIEPSLIEQAEIARKMLFADNAADDTKTDIFTKKRYALNDREYMSYLYNSKVLKYKRIFVCSNHVNGLLSYSFCSQLNVLAEKIPVFLIYNKNEYGAEKTIRYFFKDSHSRCGQRTSPV